VRYVSQSTSFEVWYAAGTRAGGETVAIEE
jgi:hypothetical protein